MLLIQLMLVTRVVDQKLNYSFRLILDDVNCQRKKLQKKTQKLYKNNEIIKA